jgi:preprotein translocase subunit YajC
MFAPAGTAAMALASRGSVSIVAGLAELGGEDLMFVSEAYAQAAGGGGGGAGGLGGITGLLPIILIFVVFYFLLIRPQQKRMKEHKAMIAAVRRGDKIQTAGGIIGTVTKVLDENEVQVEIAKEVKVRVARSTIAAVLSRAQPAGGSAEGGAPGATPPEAPQKPKSLLDRLRGS